MPLAPCPECGRQVSSEAQACPGCGHPIRAVEYCFVKVSENTRGGQTGKAHFQKLLSEGWKVVHEHLSKGRLGA